MSLLLNARPGAVSEKRIPLRAYLHGRGYRYGRGRSDIWAFIAEAVGDPAFPNARSWGELRDYLEAKGRDRVTLDTAKVLWRSYLRNAPKDLRR